MQSVVHISATSAIEDATQQDQVTYDYQAMKGQHESDSEKSRDCMGSLIKAIIVLKVRLATCTSGARHRIRGGEGQNEHIYTQPYAKFIHVIVYLMIRMM